MRVDESPLSTHAEVDRGHRAVCPKCCIRHDESKAAVGKPRDVEIRICNACDKEKVSQERPRLGGACRLVSRGKDVD